MAVHCPDELTEAVGGAAATGPAHAPPPPATRLDSKTLMGVLANDTCACLRERAPGTGNADEREMVYGLCMVQGLTERDGALETLGLDLTNEQSMQRYAVNLGMEMASRCPSIVNNLLR